MVSSSRLDSLVALAVNICIRRQLSGRGGVGTAKVLVCYPTCLPETGQEGAMHSGWIVPDGVLPTKEDARRVLDHVVALARVAGDDRGGEDVIVVAACTRRDKAVAASAPRISSPSSDDSLFGSWHIGSAKDAFEDGNATAHNDVVGDILHDRSSLACH